MNLNNFVVLPSKSKSMKLNVRNVRELRMETVQLAQQTKDMENRLEELRERMCQEKEEREKSGASHWRSALSAGLAPGFQSAKMNKENAPRKLSPGKMKIRVLKDEPVPVVQKPLVVEPANKAKGANRKLRLRGKVCGQCEVQLAGLMCSECGEDYCVGCFVRFHQKGALKHHRMIPVQAELQTPVSTRDVLGHLQQQVTGEESQPTQGAVHKSADEREATEQRPAAKNILPMSDNLTHHTQVLFVNDGVDVEDEEGAEKEESSLLRGFYDEEESARSFQMALQEWRDKRPITARPASIMGTQTERRSQHHIHVEFKEDMLSYMEKLLLKKHRRGQIEEFQSQSFVYRRPDPSTSPPTETDELSQKLTTEQMELRKYFTSLFTIAPAEDAGRVDSPAESYLSIVELDEMVGEVAMHRSFAAEPENENKMTEKENGDGEFGCRDVTSTPSLSELTRGSFCEHNSVTEIWPPSQETDQFSSHLPRPETSPPLQTRLQISQHLSATSASSETFLLNSPRGEQKVEHSSKITLSTPLCESPKPRTRCTAAHQDESSKNLLPTTSPLSPTTKLNPVLQDYDSSIVLSPCSLPSPRSSQCQSPTLLIPKRSPKPPCSPSPRSQLCSSPVNSRPGNLKPQFELKLPQPWTAVPSSRSSPREPSLSGSHSDRSLLTRPVHDSIRSPMALGIKSSHTDGYNSAPYSKWLKGSRRSPKTTTLSLQLSMSDSEEEMAGEDICCLLPSEEDSSDEELRYITDSEEKKSTSSSPCPTTNPSAELHFTFPSCSKSEHEHTELGLFTEASQALCSVSQRQHIHLGHDQGLEGFLTLGLKPEPLKSSLTLAQTPREGQNHREFSLAVGEQFWRPSSSLYHHADEELVTAMVHNRPIRSTPPAVTPCYGTMSSQRLCFSSTLSRSPPSPSRVPSAGSYRPRSFCRPLSYAAQEISEIQTVEQPEPVNIDEDEEDCLALACLEEEFRNMSITPFDQGED